MWWAWALGLLFALYVLIKFALLLVRIVAKCIGYGLDSVTGRHHRRSLKGELEDDWRKWIEANERRQAGTRPLEDPAMARWRESLEQREREEIEARRQAPVKTAERESARREGAVIPPHEYIDVVQVETADAPVWVAYLEQQGIPVRTYETGNGTVSVQVPRNQLDRARHLSGGARFQRAPRSD